MIEIKMLLENTKINHKFKNAHGLSLLVTHEGRKFLFDTGPNQKFIGNAAEMGESLADLSGVIISHGHSDHTGGLPYLNFSNQPVFVSQHLSTHRYLRVWKFFKFVGPPKIVWKNLTQASSPILDKTEIFPNIYLLPVGKTETFTANLYHEANNKKELDDFSDELMLIIREGNRLTLFTGCSHHGIITMINKAKQYFPQDIIQRVIGGFHMIGIPYINNLGISKQQVKNIAQELKSLDVPEIYTCHCTGKKAFNLMKPILRERLNYISTGEKLVFK